MKLTISPTVAWPCMCSMVPITTMAITASVLAPRVSTFTTAHQFSTGNWLADHVLDRSAEQAALGRQPGEGLHHHHVGQRVLRRARQLRLEVLDPALPRLGRAHHRTVNTTNSTTSTTSVIASRQFMKNVIGSSTTTAT